MGSIGSVAAFIILISVLVVVHEFGHFIVARMNGVFVEAFSVGMGPVLFERKDKVGTNWRISLLPVGGYVKMFGDADVTSVGEKIPEGYTEADMERMSVHRKKPWQRLFVAGAGPFANFIFSICVLFALTMVKGLPEYSNKLIVPGQNSIAYEAGLRTDDTVIKANDKEITVFQEFKEELAASSGKTLKLTIRRGEDIIDLSIKMFTEEEGKTKPVRVIGVRPKDMEYKNVGFWEAAKSAVSTTYSVARDNVRAIFRVVAGEESTKNIGGVVSIFNMAVDSADAGIAAFIWMLAVFSTVLGAINLLPVPVLDGGTVVISAIEMIIGRPLNKKFIEIIFMIGLAAVAAMMLLGLWNDLSNCKLFIWVESLFK
jgi:regulator of sigma E protease